MVDAERGQYGVDYLVSRVVSEFMKPLIKERQEREKKRGDRGSEERTVNCLSIQGEGRGRKEEEERVEEDEEEEEERQEKGVIRGDTMRDTREEERNLEGEIKTGG